MEDMQIQVLDPESEFLASKQETGNQWELFKENVRPLKRGRNIRLLNNALKSHNDIQLKKSLLDNRRRLIEAIDEYQGDDPLHPWLQCIKWVQESFPAGGDSSGLVVIYEQCVRTFWHSEHYKDDLRYLKVWLEYAENCVDAEIIYSFLEANGIGKTHSAYYIGYALHMESKSKMRAANDIFSLGISRNAQPTEKLKDAYKKFLVRSMRRPKAIGDEDSAENHLPVRSFGTVLAREQNGRQTVQSSDRQRKRLKPDGTLRASFHIYKDTNVDVMSSHQPDKSQAGNNSWQSLGALAERNKENNAVPTKWTTYKIPQRPGPRVAGATGSAHIEVFIDEECAEMHRTHQDGEHCKSSTLQVRQGDEQDIKREAELLKKNPLRNFPPNSLPR